MAPFVDLLAKLKLIYIKSKIYYTRLISDCDKDRTEKEICAERIFDLNLRPGATVEYPCQLSEYRQGDHEVVAVGLNPVVAGNRSRVDMMFSKRSQEILKEEIYTLFENLCNFFYFSNDRQLDGSPGVCRPVNHSRPKIRCQNAAHRRQNNRAEPFHPKVLYNQVKVYDHKNDAGVNAKNFLSSLSWNGKCARAFAWEFFSSGLVSSFAWEATLEAIEPRNP